MNPTILPVEGWVERCASYALTIVRSVVTQLRDGGPLGGSQVCTIIVRAGIGADVSKASPFFDPDDGAERILNFLVADIDEIVREGDIYSVAADTREVRSKARGFTVNIPPADEAALAAEASYRAMHLRTWAASRPFQNIWRDGLVPHTDDEVIALADWISTVGYLGDLIVRDQNGIIISGHLRHAALSKLGINPVDYTQEVVFTSEFHRLAFVLADHWPVTPAFRDAVKKAVNRGAARTGVKLRWPGDLPIICAHGQTVLTAPSPVLAPPTGPSTILDVPPRTRESRQTWVARDTDIYQIASWLRNNPRHTQGQVTQAVKGDDAIVAGTLTDWKQRGLIRTVGRNKHGMLLEVTEEGIALLDAPVPVQAPPRRIPYRKPDGTYISGPPGASYIMMPPKGPAVQRLIAASNRGEWTLRSDLELKLKFAHTLRKNMWFYYMGDSTWYLFIPDTIRGAWKKAQVRRLAPEEAALLADLRDRKEDLKLYETWEALVEAEYERLFG